MGVALSSAKDAMVLHPKYLPLSALCIWTVYKCSNWIAIQYIEVRRKRRIANFEAELQETKEKLACLQMKIAEVRVEKLILQAELQEVQNNINHLLNNSSFVAQLPAPLQLSRIPLR